MNLVIDKAVKFAIREISLRDLYEATTPGVETTEAQFGIKSGYLQRELQKSEWCSKNHTKSQEYLYTVMIGSAILDHFVIVPIKFVLKSLKEKALINTQGLPKETWKEIIEDVEEDQKNGTEYYIIDGQNRCLNAIKPFFENKFPLGQKLIRAIDTNTKGSFEFSGKKYNEFTDEMKEYFDNITLNLYEAESGDIDSYIDSLIAKNEGLPWTDWMKTLTRQWWTKYHKQIKEITEDKEVFDLLKLVNNKSYELESNGHELIISELLIWMDKQFQPDNLSTHIDYFEGKCSVSQSNVNKLKSYIREFKNGYKQILDFDVNNSGKKTKGKNKRSTLSNVEFRNYIMLRFALDHPTKFDDHGIDVPFWNIQHQVEFVNQYRLINESLLVVDDTNYDFFTVSGKKDKRAKPLSFVWANGMSEKTRIFQRLKLLCQKFKAKEEELKNQNIIVEKDDNKMPSLGAVYENNPIVIQKGNSKLRATEIIPKRFDRGHIKSKNNGGTNNIDNLVVQDKKHNRSTKDKNLDLNP